MDSGDIIPKQIQTRAERSLGIACMDNKHDISDDAWRSWGGALGIAIVLGIANVVLRWVL